jgi:biopolymer transport protein ExbD
MTAFSPKVRGGRITVDMTPMIDIVFQLLTFFCLTLKIAAVEGDFHIQMPRAAPGPNAPSISQLPPFVLTMEANSGGNLTRLTLNEVEFTGVDRFRRLHQWLLEFEAKQGLAAELDVELRCDPRLDYQYVIDAFTAVSGSKNQLGEIVPLIQRIQFVPLK